MYRTIFHQLLIKSIRLTVIIPLVLFTFCVKRNSQTFTKHPSGYYFKLHSFITEKNSKGGTVAKKISSEFLTQDDSVFYDSFHDLADAFYLTCDTGNSVSLMKQAMSRAVEGDSLTLLIPVKIFFEEQFKSAVPKFCRQDSIIKINFIVEKDLNAGELLKINDDLAQREVGEIRKYFEDDLTMSAALDPLGFYWIEKNGANNSDTIKAGEEILVQYTGGFLNGRMIDFSPAEFRFVYGTPDQLIKGLNYVIAKSKKGQTSKIILPSQLAFGEYGSSNGSVPPFTPMLYSISVN